MSTWTPVTPKGGGLTHATSLSKASRTACNKRFVGWKVSTTSTLNCEVCKAVIEEYVKESK
jgi:hypothetical protein